MKVLVVGGGGREHAIVKALKNSPLVGELYCAPGNGGISADAQCVPIAATDVSAMVDFAVGESVDFVVVAPDDPLVLGMVDALNKKGVATFGPNKAAAEIEGSKAFAKELMRKYNIPTADYGIYSDKDQALRRLRGGKFPVVIKADGLALGKGVIIAETLIQAEEAITRIMEDKVFGKSGDRVVIEEFLTGPEVSVLCFTDGKTLVPMVSSMDHKRIWDGNRGPNTGGMGAIAPNPHYTPEIASQCMKTIFLPTVRAMAAEGRPFKGCLYFGLMLTEEGPRVIEYNCRFGDPETQVVLPLLQTDLMEVMQAVYEERLDKLAVVWKPGVSACVVLASGGYPGAYPKGVPISGLERSGQRPDAIIYHAGTALADGGFVTNGGRVLGVTTAAHTLPTTLQKAYAAVEGICFDGMQYRRDIGKY